jgi:hypothetical protein
MKRMGIGDGLGHMMPDSARWPWLRLFGNPPLEFHWQQTDGAWLLRPSMIRVQANDGYWEVLFGNRPLNSRYTSEQGAKLDAWEYVKRHHRALFGAYRVMLR